MQPVDDEELQEAIRLSLQTEVSDPPAAPVVSSPLAELRTIQKARFMQSQPVQTKSAATADKAPPPLLNESGREIYLNKITSTDPNSLDIRELISDVRILR